MYVCTNKFGKFKKNIWYGFYFGKGRLSVDISDDVTHYTQKRDVEQNL